MGKSSLAPIPAMLYPERGLHLVFYKPMKQAQALEIVLFFLELIAVKLVLGTGGIQWYEWQYWVIMLLLVVASL